MSLKRLFFIIIFVSVFAGSFVFCINKAFLYSPETTHYNLTQEMIKLYNLTYEPDLTSRQRELILRGSIDEDIKPRPVFHLYDPVYNRSPAQFLGIDLVYTAKQWALTDSQESIIVKFAYILWNFFKSGFEYHGNYSWPASMKYFADGDKDKAYYGLGHILHLIEDMSVPAHSRNDPHVGGDPYEDWANANNDAINFNLAEPLYNKGYQPAYIYSPGQAFDELARYSNKYFFSQDSILNKDYNSPKIIKERQEDFGKYLQRTYAIGLDENGEFIRLAYKDYYKSTWREISPSEKKNDNVYVIDEKEPKIHQDYWIRLAPKAVQYGTGVIKLFIDETEYQARLGKNEPELNWWQKAQVFIQDLLGIGEDKGKEQAEETTSYPSYPWEHPPMRFPNVGPAPQTLEEPIGNSVESPLPEKSNDRKDQDEPTDNQGEVKGESIEKEQEKNKGGAVVVTGPKTGDGGGASRPDTQEPAQASAQPSTPPEPPITGPEDTTPPDVLIESLTYNYASSSLFLEWSSLEIPSVSFDVEYKKDDSDWQNLLASTSETQASFSVDIQDIVYYFRVRAMDSVGNESAWQEKSIEILSKPVIINEIAWMGTTADYNDEWIELYNRADYDVDLTDWILESMDGTPSINLISNISSHSYFLLERTDDETISNIPADGIYTGAMNNEGEKFQLKDNKGNIIDQVDCEINWYAGENETKRTMERVNPAAPGTDSQNWQTYIDSGSDATDADGNLILGTPKFQNSVYDTNPPTKIEDLAVSDSSGTFLILQWTAPSDEKSSISLIYDIRYASESINEENWASLTQIADIPLVENPGTLQVASISGLKYDATYYFAIKTFDGANVSELSNVLIYSTGSPPVLAKSSWPVFQRDVGHSGFSPYVGPDFTASSSITPRWIVDIGTPIYASPVIGLDGTIYVGDIMGKFYAINSITGEPKWVYDTYNHELGRGGIYFSAAIASDGTIYIFGGGSPYLYALTPTGKLKWRYLIGTPNTTASSPVIGLDGTIYITDNNYYLYAINPDGTLKWDYYVSGAFSILTPALGPDETIYIGWNGSSNSGYVTALDSDGNYKWTTENINALAGQAPTIDSDGVIYVVSAVGSLRTINPADGSVTWVYNTGPSFGSAALSSSGIIYIVNQSGVLQPVNPDGTYGGWIFSAGGIVRNAPIIDFNEVIYFGSDDKKIYAVNSNGTLKWDYELSDAGYSSLVIDDSGVLYVATADGKVYAIGE